jgi:hypothetical protein
VTDVSDELPVERVLVSKLTPHPRNYRKHPEDQLAHLAASIKANGFYRNVVVARDYTILAGHGTTEAAKKAGLKKVPVVVLDLDPDEPRALKVLAGDNEIARLAETDDRALTEMLKSIMEQDDLLGSGFDKQQLAALALVTRPASELQSLNEAAQWVGMPGYEEGDAAIKLVVSFKTDEDRDEFIKRFEIRIDKSAIKGTTMSTRWPWTDREKNADIRFEANGE